MSGSYLDRLYKAGISQNVPRIELLRALTNNDQGQEFYKILRLISLLVKTVPGEMCAPILTISFRQGI
jgi:hypothetical protein